MADELKITVTDIRESHCAIGLYGWCKRNGIDFRKLMDDGIDAEVLLATGDELARKVVERVREKRNG
ncbi:hypothetical protein AEAC466_04290 [Asticcacaulis sp. AC466]|uniref:hypothetical protein n=1 Tax=Asticcacaulis sp. AC466 TaxID=1282362 RepID=UPI0003C3D451|nr:hypothetical protein [Asticcacaulis sp. AC466]ESQ85380.1 hypothetical protein AEAC466_04290 [Asticcacaulis sp. AC466]